MKYFISPHLYNTLYIHGQVYKHQHKKHVIHKIDASYYEIAKDLIEFSNDKKYKSLSPLLLSTHLFMLYKPYIPDIYVFSQFVDRDIVGCDGNRVTVYSYQFSRKALHYLIKKYLNVIDPRPNSMRIRVEIDMSYILYEINKYGKPPVSWSIISKFERLEESFIIKYQDYLNWRRVTKYYNNAFTETLVSTCSSHINWKTISEIRNISGDFMSKYKDQLDWDIISRKYPPSRIPEKLYRYINWEIASQVHGLGDPFIKKYKKNIDLDALVRINRISKEYRDKLK